jgi:NAD(P)H dehydrogenase (quinone)
MYAVTGITGQVGGGVARTLLDTGLPVRAVVRDTAKGVSWKERGCEVALAEMNDASALTAAFTHVHGVFVLLPSNFDPMPGFPEVRAIITTLMTAIEAAKPPKIVFVAGAVVGRCGILTETIVGKRVEIGVARTERGPAVVKIKVLN